jgi:hypothetical protein
MIRDTKRQLGDGVMEDGETIKNDRERGRWGEQKSWSEDY